MIEKSLAHFQIQEKVGEGGMGVVYRAHDTKLGRDVALKILPPSFLQDPERLARFRREAKVLASLNHSNIAAIHGLEEADGQLFLVMELAGGEDLSQRLERGAIGADETLDIARQLVAGLEAAHESGVVHRDLKPANVKLDDDGKVKILDFGLARAWADDPAAEEDLANSPTITAAMTQAGVILGTAAYMSPEQARGKAVDRRADIWSLGVILFEMLTGERLFEGETVSDTLAGVLKTDVDFDRLPDDTPDELRWLIVRCLQRQPANRLRDVGEARIALDGPASELSGIWSSASLPALEEPAPARRLPVLLAVLGLVVGAAAVWFLRPAPEPPPPVTVRAALLAPAGYEYDLESGGHLALSPDGTQLAFVARDSLSEESLWVRRLGTAAPYQLSGTEDASYPFWSPDGEKIGFFVQGRMRKIDASGGVATTICNAGGGRGGSWTDDGRILFAPTNRDPIHVVSDAGGEPVAVTVLDTVASTHRWPHVLPGNRHFLYTTREENDRYHLNVAAMDGSEARRVLEGVYGGRFADGHVFFARDDALWARPFDPVALAFTGEEFLVNESVVDSDNFGGAAYGVSETGNLVFATATSSAQTWFVAIDPEGSEEYRLRMTEGRADRLDLSPDQRHMLMRIQGSDSASDSDIWVRDLQRETLTRLTTGEQADWPLWSPDGERIAYRRGEDTLVIRNFRGAREVLLEAGIAPGSWLHDWSPDGRFILSSLPGGSGSDLWMIPVDAPDEAWMLQSDTGFNTHPSFSPDGRWVAHMSTVGPTAQIYMRSVEPGGNSYQVSSGFGVWADWSPSGDAIYYVNDGIMRVDVDWSGPEPELGREQRHRDIDIIVGRRGDNQYVVREDGGFYYWSDEESGTSPDLAVDLVVGWRALILGE